jgi:hypothetical protein
MKFWLRLVAALFVSVFAPQVLVSCHSDSR